MKIRNITKRIIRRLHSTFFPTIQDRELRRWYRDDGDRNHRFAYALNPESVVIDLGGYDGQWTSDLFSRSPCSVYVFEAIPEFAQRIARRFVANPRIKVFPYAIGSNPRSDYMSVDGVGSSLFRRTDQRVAVRVEDAGNLFALCNISHCNLLKVNIEGGEYEVLPRLIETGLIRAIDNLQIQFHNLRFDSLAQMNTIQADIAKTHELTWQYTWVWENWKRKDG